VSRAAGRAKEFSVCVGQTQPYLPQVCECLVVLEGLSNRSRSLIINAISAKTAQRSEQYKFIQDDELAQQAGMSA
jgi:hypothetical protein